MRHALLALLAKEETHGYELKRSLQQEFGDVWPAINMGQIYTTLRRLERDGLVTSRTVAQAERPDKKVFAITASGHEELRAWIDASPPEPRVRDDFFEKLVLSRRARLADPVALIDRHRRSLLRQLHGLQQLGEVATTTAARLAVDGTVLHLQADLKWLEHCERAFTSERKRR